MKKKIILSIFGTRPEAIKMAPVIKEIEKSKNLTSIVCVTAQHREMLDQALDLFGIFPDFDLNIMKPGQDLTDITVRILTELKVLLRELKPDLILVHGDTTTSFVAGLAAFYEGIPIGHVEAGLRTYKLDSPFPEEGNRRPLQRASEVICKGHRQGMGPEASAERRGNGNKTPWRQVSLLDAGQKTLSKNRLQR